MPVYRIDSFDGDKGGLDFGEFWHDPALVANVVLRFSAKFLGARCYCFRLNPVHGTRDSTFEPYNGTGLSSHEVESLPTLNFTRLLPANEQWPVLGRWMPDGSDSRHPGFLANGKWHGQVRLKSGDDYVGFLKAVIVDGTVPDDDIFRIAYREVKQWLDGKREERRRNAIWTSVAAQTSLHSTLTQVKVDLNQGRRPQAIYHLAAFITSHLGSGFNRIACLLPSPTGALVCEHAHGGDCSPGWANKVQDAISQEVFSPDQLLALVRRNYPPIADALYDELVVRGPLHLPLNALA